MNPEHLHLLVNHIPIHGLVFCTLSLIIGLVLRNRLLIGVSTVLITLASLSIPVVMGSGEAAYERYENNPELREQVGEMGLDVAHEHYQDAETGAKATYLLILWGVVNLVFWKFRPQWFVKTAYAMAAMAVVCLLINAWIASSGGQIRRPDFRAKVMTETTLHSR